MKIGILGPKNTSTDLACKNYLINNSKINTFEIIYLDSFEDIYENILTKKVNLAVVPSAYFKINKFFMSRELDLFDFVKHDTLEYHALIKEKEKENLLSKKIIKIGLKEETFELVTDFFQSEMFLGKQIEYIICNSTQSALLKMKQNKVDISICNNAGLDSEIVSLKNFGRIQMTWNIFINNK